MSTRIKVVGILMPKKIVGLLLLLLSINIYAQDNKLLKFDTGIDWVSGYNWRGQNYGNSSAIQPYMSLNMGNFEFMVWGSYSLIAQEKREDMAGQIDKVPFSEIDLTLKYNLETEIGTFSPKVADYYFPYLGGRFSDYKNYEEKDGEIIQGSHWLNFELNYRGPESFPVGFTFDYAFHNDPDKPVYLELSYPFEIDDFTVDLVLGAAKGKNKTELYGIETDKFAVVNAGVTFNKEIKISENFNLPVSASFIVNPNSDMAFIVFKLSL